MTAPLDALIYDWNRDPLQVGEPPRAVSFLDESLRDGLQSPSVTNPPLEAKLRLLHLMVSLGITAMDAGLPGAGARAAADAEALCREIVAQRLPIRPNCAARTAEEDIIPVLEIMDRIGAPLEIALFVGVSPIRCHVEDWPVAELLRRSERCVQFAVTRGARVTFVTEDTTRSHPDDLRSLFRAAVGAGATRVCLADTAGHATPAGTRRLVAFARQVLAEAGAGGMCLDWHGHNDRGLAVANALAAAAAGVDRMHGTVLGIGERVGNPPMEQLLVNARLLGWAKPDLSALMDYVGLARDMFEVEVPPWAPIVGRDAFRTTTGVHAAAIVKAGAKGDADLMDLVYSAIPASWMQRAQEIDVGPMSGTSNIRHWLLAKGYAPDPRTVERILSAVKQANRTLSDAEMHALAAAQPEV